MTCEHKFQRKGKNKQSKVATAKALWPPDSLDAYVGKLDELLEAVRLEEVAHERYLKTQEALIKASLHAACPSEAAEPKEDTESIALRKLIDERKSSQRANQEDDAKSVKTFEKKSKG